MLEQFNRYRDENGYIRLDEFEGYTIKRKTYGSRVNKTWFNIDGNYLFKASLGYLEEIKELINEAIAMQVSVPNAEYDIAIYKGKKGIISKDFIQDAEFIPMLCLLCEFNNVHNHILNFYNALQSKCKTQDELATLIIHFFNIHRLDIFTCQHDRNFKNLAVLELSGHLIPVPRYDSAGSFLNIAKHNKVNQFMGAHNKSDLLKKYNGVRTKLRVLPGDVRQNSIDELLQARYYPDVDVPNLLREQLGTTDDFVCKIENIDWNQIFYILNEHSIHLAPIYQDFFRTVVNIKLEEYHKKKQLIRQ